MLFNSFDFVFFFIIVTALYFLLPHKFRWVHLLAASCYFYMAFVPIYILILFGTIVIDYYAGILIENNTGKRRKLFLTMSLIANIGVLAIFKYYNFFIININEVISYATLAKLPLLKILLPIGLSFHTFQAMSYTIEVYRGNHKAERHFGIYALYVMFYPQLVAGPIERPQNILYQFYEKHSFDWNNVHEGLKKMLWGFVKKVVIADRLAIIVDNVYNKPHGHTGPEMVMASLFFTFQIYCDFSGYSDIALGTAEIMGFKLMVNFNKPNFATSVSDFWRRWHISLSTWFRDYLYIGLGGKSKTSKYRTYLNLFIVFMVSGFWHGAAWTFIVWGAFHGSLIVLGAVTKKARVKAVAAIGLDKFPKLHTTINVLQTFLLVAFSRIFFRSASLSDAFYVIRHLGTDWHLMSAKGIKALAAGLGAGDIVYGAYNIILGILLIVALLLSEKLSGEHVYPLDAYTKRPAFLRWSVYYILIISICLIGVYENKEFIYFQF